jgi:hypothetical protein
VPGSSGQPAAIARTAVCRTGQLDLPASEGDHRRGLAGLRFLERASPAV